jgi:small-conductance mechanosensitive channel
MRAPRRRGPVLALLLLLPLLLLASAAAAQPAPARQGGLSGEDIERLTTLLQDEARRTELLRTLEALAAASRAAAPAAAGAPEAGAPTPRPPPAGAAAPAADPQGAVEGGAPPPAAPPGVQASPAGAPAAAAAAPAPATAAEPIIAPNTTGALVLQWLSGLEGRLGPVSQELLEAVRSMADLPSLWGAVEAMARSPVARTRLLDAAWKLVLILGLALLAERLAIRALARPRARLDAAAPEEAGTVWTWLRRVPLLLARLLLDLLPVAAFALAVYGLLGLVRPLPTTQAVGLMAAQVYVAARVVFSAARMLLAPGARRLRLIPCSDELAGYCLQSLRRLLTVGLGGYALAEAGIALGLSWAAYDAVLNLTLLLMTLLLVRMVVQQRAAVAAALRAPALAPGEAPDRGRRMLRALRDRLAEVWHVATILWLLAAWAVWALAVEDGLGRLFTSTLLAAGVAAAAKLLDAGLSRLLDRMVGAAPGAAAGLARAVTYLPVLRTVISLVAAAAGLLLLLEVWGLDTLGWFAAGTLGSRLLGTLLSIGATFLAAMLVWEAANAAIARRLARLARESQAASRSARLRTLLPMLRTALGIVVVVFLALSTLSELGVNVAPLLAGAGVVGLAIGFGSQTLVRDVITGVFLLLEDAVAVGDVVTLGGLSGVVEHLSIRSIKLRATDGSVHIIPFSAVTTVTNMTRDFAFAVVDVNLSYDADPDQVAEVLREISAEMRAEPKWAAMIRDDIDVWGVDKMSDQGVMVRARVKTGPSSRWPVAREFNRRIRARFAELGIEMVRPFGQRLVMEQPPTQQRPAAAPGGAGLGGPARAAE